MKILVGDLSSEVSPDFLQKIFQVYGSIASVSLTVDSSTNETIGEVEMPDEIEALNAIESIDGNRIEGQVFTIKNKSDFNIDANPESSLIESTGSKKSGEKRTGDERRGDDSPLFKADRGIVIDRRDDIDRRNNPNVQDDNGQPLETI